MSEDAVAGAAPHFAERAFERVRMEFTRASAFRADDRVMAARGAFVFVARTHRRRSEHTVEQTHLEQGSDVAIHRDSIDAHACAAKLAMQFGRSERARRKLDQAQ